LLHILGLSDGLAADTKNQHPDICVSLKRFMRLIGRE
jgi:hypothetical protein